MTEGSEGEARQREAEDSDAGPSPRSGDPEGQAPAREHVEEAPSETSTDAPDRPLLEEALAWEGDKLDDLGGSSIGRVEGVYVDEGSREPEWLLARMGLFGHYTLIPARDAVGAAGRVWVPYTRDQIRAAPRFKRDSEVTKGVEAAYLSHYGIDATGRAAEIAERADDSVSAVPARDV